MYPRAIGTYRRRIPRRGGRSTRSELVVDGVPYNISIYGKVSRVEEK